MNYLKLFEDFEEKPFEEINTEDLINYSDNLQFEEIDEYPNLLDKLKRRLPNIFGHSDFYIDSYNEKCIFIYERIHSLICYSIYLKEDDWFYLEVKDYNAIDIVVKYYKCDDIGGLMKAIKYSFGKRNTNLWTTLRYVEKDDYFGDESRDYLFNTKVSFERSEFFPYKKVKEVINKYNTEYNLISTGRNIFIYTEDYKDSIFMDYVSETNRFNCFYEKTGKCVACLGLEGLNKWLKNDYFI